LATHGRFIGYMHRGEDALGLLGESASEGRGAVEAGCYRSNNCDLPCTEGGIGDRCRNDQGPPSKPR